MQHGLHFACSTRMIDDDHAFEKFQVLITQIQVSLCLFFMINNTYALMSEIAQYDSYLKNVSLFQRI